MQKNPKSERFMQSNPALFYERFMQASPTLLDTMVNSIGQTICFYEHPVLGEDAPIIVVSHDLKLVARSCFFDMEDMKADHLEYEPYFENGRLMIGRD